MNNWKEWDPYKDWETFKALAGTPNGIGVQRMLIAHAGKLRKRISKIYTIIYKGAFHMLILISDA